ncbi:cholinesterase 1-like [Pararge aegeria]|uniref:cholinesterase 1-like n=1 Tax=Pararge aegeria TaxID=116150 RepID=UPI0019D0E57B|nr:cholinesterase 1-like [Pararge aegeria]
MKASSWLVLWSLWAARFVQQPTMPVRTHGGWLRGLMAPDGSYKQYLAIPYATIPENRFQAPDKAPTWRGVFDAVEEYIRCPQRFSEEGMVLGQEDCLVLNIYTPAESTPSSKYPVMVFIHGGAFFEGSATTFLYSGGYLVRKKVIFVTFNYRFNIQGHLCLGIKEAAGNAGMKDQVAALKWIQRNIKAFGGDPDNVTLFGVSSGAASVSYHMLSPMSEGLFHKVIIESASSLAPWAFQFRPVYTASLLTKAMGYTTEDPYEIYNILLEKTDEELVRTRVPRQIGNTKVSEPLYSPCLEKKIVGEEAFLTDLPFNLLSKGKYNKVPMIIGRNIEEGLFLAGMENVTSINNMRVEKSLPKDLAIPNEDVRNEIVKKLERYYMDNKNISYETIGNLSRLLGEIFFVYPVLEETELHLENNDSPVYTYVFNYDGWRNMAKFSLLSWVLCSFPGATHADEMFYLFSQPMLPSMFESKMIDRMTTMWTNFAKYGDPTPESTALLPVKWTAANKSSPESLVIDAEFSTAPLYSRESLKYLREIYSKYRRKED